MASSVSTSTPLQKHRNIPHVCSIIPPNLLLAILESNENSESTRAAVQNTYHHCCKLQERRKIRQTELRAPVQGVTARGQSIIPSYVFQAIADSDDASPAQKEHAQGSMKFSQTIHSTRSGADKGSVTAQQGAGTSTKETPTAEGVRRKIYDSKKTSKLRKVLVVQEGGKTTSISDQSAVEVFDSFGKTYQFYKEVFNRDSVDDDGLALIGSVHYDDIPGPPGMDNAFWDGDEMAFGDGDGDIFGSFTKNIDVIGHELTHGVVQHTANLEYEFQSGALNESMADVFGTMIKQYFAAGGPQLAEDADWLIGEGIFQNIPNAKALRSMKAPGTAYNNPRIGKDQQPADMDGYKKLKNTDAGDYGGVHINSGIPNRAFYLVATALKGYSWDKAGKIWYAALNDEQLQGIDTSAAFKIFADLTSKYALSLYDEETEAVVKKAWGDVKVYRTTTTHEEV